LWLGLVEVGGLAMGSVQVNTSGSRWDLALSLEQAGLQVDDVVAQLVVFRLEGLVQLAQLLEFLDLVLELLDVLFFALTEGALAGLA
jgi:hypothetical protein